MSTPAFYELPFAWQTYILDQEDDARKLHDDLKEAEEFNDALVRECDTQIQVIKELMIRNETLRQKVLEANHPHLRKPTYSKPPLMPGKTEIE